MPPINVAGLSFGSSSSLTGGSLTNRAAQLFSDIQSRSKRRNAIKYDVVLSHKFEDVPLTEPTICSQCHELVWLMPTPFCKRCVLCKLTSHKKCLANIVSSCIKSMNNQQALKDRLSHKFVPNFFLSPTWCRHCGVLIKGVTSWQGFKCSCCGMNVHRDCKDLVGHLCGLQLCRHKKSIEHSVIKIEPKLEEFMQNQNVSIKDFDIIGLIGKGSFSKVYLGKYKYSREGKENKFAIKVLKKTEPAINGDPKSVLTEMEALKLGQQHPFLTVVHCCFQTRDRLYFVMEHVIGRNLFEHRAKQRGGKFTENITRFYLAEIVLALNFLHSKGIIYRDLKLEHVILERSGHCKLLDFGMAKQLTQSELTTRTFCGTPYYISPEVIREQDYGFSVDWWALGVLMFEMLSGYSPFETQDDDMNELYKKIAEDEVELYKDSNISDEAISMLSGLLTKDPHIRLGCNILEGCEQAIFDHPFFLHNKNHRWDSVKALSIKPPYTPANEDIELLDYDKEVLELTPVEPSELEKVSQDDFHNFSYTSEYLKSDA